VRDGLAYDDYRIGIEEGIKTDPKFFLCMLIYRKKRVGYPYVIENQSGSGS
jgi:hypothetical protein